MIYKKPIIINQAKEAPKQESVSKDRANFKSDIDLKKVIRKEEPKSFDGYHKKASEQKQLTERDVRGIVESYMQEINVNSISDEIIDRLDGRTELSRYRNGILDF